MVGDDSRSKIFTHKESMYLYLLDIVGINSEFNKAITTFYKNEDNIVDFFKSKGLTFEILTIQEE